eukprot:CAMPEP_0182428934 /NCGR_PEP_ID=MMETSP1167-20130531/24726_1 /TAXON_ID=2988 /ORGANISM="Mallomonas Sp, Strain CCMP3275" /LENGTH=291 /DNA_ID=CAMNT_0024612165 /DNA_START=85 /DNA_END=960 /DNA_ORIENTATION=-
MRKGTQSYEKDEKKKSKPSSSSFSPYVLVVLIVLAIGGYAAYNSNESKSLLRLYGDKSSNNTEQIPLGSFMKQSITSKTPESQVVVDDCSAQWRPDKLIGRCFGLKAHTEFAEMKDIPVIASAEECKAMCCRLGDKCVSWQYWSGTSTCKMGDAVRLGDESAGTPLWCEPNPPVTWNGYKIKSRIQSERERERERETNEASAKECTIGDKLPTQCFGMGPERKGTSPPYDRLNTEACAAACCKAKGCVMWQELPNRGCFFSDDNQEHYCDEYLGTFDGGRKCVKGFCGEKE